MENISMLTADRASLVFAPRLQTQCLDRWWSVNNTLAYRVICFVCCHVKHLQFSSNTNIRVSINRSQTADITKWAAGWNKKNKHTYFFCGLTAPLHCVWHVVFHYKHMSKLTSQYYVYKTYPIVKSYVYQLVFFLYAWYTFILCNKNIFWTEHSVNRSYLCSDWWMERMTPELRWSCLRVASTVNSFLPLSFCSICSETSTGAFTSLEDPE